MTRNGKIARLPGLIRDELNQRLENGEDGPTLLPWLNDLPEVQARLKENFDGAPINKQNLSEWRLGGFREAQIRQELLDQACQLAEGASEMERAVETASLPGALAAMLAARFAAVLNSWDGEPDEKVEAKLRLLRRLNHDIALLQKTVQRASQQKRESEQAEEAEDRRENEEMRTRMLNMLHSGPEREALSAALGGGERGHQLAKMITAVKYDLPLSPDEAKRVKTGPTGSSSVKPSQAQSNQVKPGVASSNKLDATTPEANEGEQD